MRRRGQEKHGSDVPSQCILMLLRLKGDGNQRLKYKKGSLVVE